ncbi:hypothetical protein N7533_001918 [Penicillium manginii]|jgi:hypothetical protein|uniref:uncharacterized protein n=1 Tax=Penicillium manginii TaxID=203109 RepID=UPI002548FADE|nr:uncharacterized protein N7533_001918 [Penicillium manginii]KAJ5763237.1 hypothetical protein N7533_001918 [Penicillium manginii]
MIDHHFDKRYGVHPVDIQRSLYIGIKNKPLTAEQIRKNQIKKRNIQLQENYNNECRDLIQTLDDKTFVTDSLALMISHLSGEVFHISYRGAGCEEENENVPLPERRANLRARLADARSTLPTDITTLNSIGRILLSQSSKVSNWPELATPDTFYRAIRSDSYTRFDKQLGFRSSRQPLTLPSNHGGPLYESSLIDKDSLVNQCEGDQSSDLIAMSDSPARILRLIKSWDFSDLRGQMIAVINVQKLLAMKVLFNRTTTLAERLGMKTWTPSQPRGIRWANPNYWVAYRWVPAECIQSYISVASLRDACIKYEIGKLFATSDNEMLTIKANSTLITNFQKHPYAREWGN